MDTLPYLEVLEAQEIQPSLPYPQGAAESIRNLLQAVGEDPDREGLQRTPQRVAHMYGELLAGYQTDVISLVNGAIFDSDYQGPVIVRDIEYYSLCEHHLLPFFGKAHVAYVPDGKIIGLSKIPRLVEMFARRLQVQERMTQQIADQLAAILQPKGVAVVLEGAHLCARMRGVQKDQANMVTEVMSGVFLQDARLREDFLSTVRR